jgi:D-alanyl-D-alanine carboxypeptidase (penicillin-binding protein 5/6)
VAAWLGLAVTALIVVVLVRALTLTVPDVVVSASSPRTVRLPGSAPTPTWPESGQAALVVEGIGSLGAVGGTTPVPIASLTKVMTAYLTLRKYPLAGQANGFELTVTRADVAAEHSDAGEDQSVVPVQAGERLSERQLLEALLIPSGDNIARMLAAYVAGSDARFLVEMNRAARRLGMTHTTYTDPSGYEPSTVSVASDQLRIFKRAMASPVFRTIVAEPSATLPVAGTVQNYDPLIADGYAGKTGSDSEAEGCLAFFKYVTVAGRRLTVVGVVLGQGVGSTTSIILGAAGDAAAAMVDSVTPHIRLSTVLPAHSTVMVATTTDGRRVAAVTSSPLTVIGWGGTHERLSVRPATLSSAGLSAGEPVGRVALAGGLPTESTGSSETVVRASRALSKPGFGWRLEHVL